MTITTATVIGLGKIGLPLAVKLCENIQSVYGLDISSKVVEKVNSGQSPVPGEPQLDEKLSAAVLSGKLKASVDESTALHRSQVIIIVVPLLIGNNGQPDFSSIDSATSKVGQNLQPGTLVVFETTLPVGTTRKRFGAILEKESGLRMGQDFYLAFSPERVSSGSVFADLNSYPKLIGGVDSHSAQKAEDFYIQVLDFKIRHDLGRANGVWNLGSTEAAELAKLLETTYRDVNIGLANQFAEYARKIDVDIYQLIEAANSQPFSHIHTPGISVGGHCIPVYPHFYLQGHPEATIVSEARTVNKLGPTRAVAQIEETSGSIFGKKVAILGLAYRGGVKEAAFSGAFDLVSEIEKHGGTAYVHDPLYSDAEIINLNLKPFKLGETCDIAILHTAHKEYKDLNPHHFVDCPMFYDGRNFAPTVIREEMNYISIAAN